MGKRAPRPLAMKEPATATNNLFRCRSRDWYDGGHNRCRFWFWHSRRWMHGSENGRKGWS